MNTKKVSEHIVEWLRSYCLSSSLKGFVVGISGGIDSAVTSTLCANTGFPTLAVNMPIRQKAAQESLSDQHIEWLMKAYSNVSRQKIDLTTVLEAFEASLLVNIQDELSMANTRSRIRMTTLYAFASHNRLLVAGTGNKIEDFGVGFYTKYGDGGVDISPIADLMKSEVYEIARYYGILEDIINAEPTDGLWEDDRTDESQIGATYSELEWAMNLTKREDCSDQLTDRQKEVLEKYRRFNRANKHKMEPIPVCHIPDTLR